MHSFLIRRASVLACLPQPGKRGRLPYGLVGFSSCRSVQIRAPHRPVVTTLMMTSRQIPQLASQPRRVATGCRASLRRTAPARPNRGPSPGRNRPGSPCRSPGRGSGWSIPPAGGRSAPPAPGCPAPGWDRGRGGCARLTSAMSSCIRHCLRWLRMTTSPCIVSRPMCWNTVCKLSKCRVATSSASSLPCSPGPRTGAVMLRQSGLWCCSSSIP